MLSHIKGAIKKVAANIATKSNYKFLIKEWSSLEDLDALSAALKSKRFTQNLNPVTISRLKAGRVLFIAPHPDDEIFSSGGALIKMIKSGSRIEVIYLTESAPNIEAEAAVVSRQLGTEIRFCRYPKRGIEINEKSVAMMREAQREARPDKIFIPFIADDHADHRMAARLFYESFKDEKVLDVEVWAYQVYSTLIPNVVVDITDVMDEKVRLINLWKTRMGSRDWAHYIKGQNAVNSRFLDTNETRFAETFFVIPAKEYIELCGRYFSTPVDRRR